jgi:hypothetical protein
MVAERWDRKSVQRASLALLNEKVFTRIYHSRPEVAHQLFTIVLRTWARSGAQSVQLPHTYAAALAASDVGKAIETSKLPWDCFEVLVPAGLVPLVDPNDEIVSLFCCRTPKNDDAIDASVERIGVCYMSSKGMLSFANFETIGQLVDTKDVEVFDQALEEGTLSNAERELRVWEVLRRLLAGIILHVEAARADHPGSFAGKELRLKRDQIRPNTWTVGSPLKLDVDCTNLVRNYVQGTRGSIHVTTIVRGHWAHQPHGPNHSLRKLIWRKPHQRGDGPMLVRPVVLSPREV